MGSPGVEVGVEGGAVGWTGGATVTLLNAKPANIKLKDPNSGKTYTIILTGSRMVAVLSQLLYSSEFLPYMPALISRVQSGDYELLNIGLEELLFRDDVSYGMYFSVECQEEAPFNKPEEGAANLQKILPELRPGNDPASFLRFAKIGGFHLRPRLKIFL